MLADVPLFPEQASTTAAQVDHLLLLPDRGQRVLSAC